MKVLQICQKPPLPPIDGGCVASHRLSIDLKNAGFEVKVVSMATAKHPFRPNLIPKEYLRTFRFEGVHIDTNTSVLLSLKSFFSAISIQFHRFYHKQFADFLKKILQEEKFDIVVFDGLMTAFYHSDIRELTDVPMVFRSHNVEWQLLRQRAESASNFLMKKMLIIETRKLLKFERETWFKMDLILPISQGDLEVIEKVPSCSTKLKWLPFSMDIDDSMRRGSKNKIFHLGSMDWKPNHDGVIWFLREVWPMVLSVKPHAELHIGGKGMESIIDLPEAVNTFIHEQVDDVRAFVEPCQIMVVPIKSGSGTRIKVLQSLAWGRSIVSTSKGTRGMGLTHEKEVLVSDDARIFAGNIVRLMDDDELRGKLIAGGLQFMQSNHGSDQVSGILRETIQELQSMINH